MVIENGLTDRICGVKVLGTEGERHSQNLKQLCVPWQDAQVQREILQTVHESCGHTNAQSATNPYRDDILNGSEDPRGQGFAMKEVELIRDHLLAHGLPTKPPVNLYDFSNGPTKALGIELYDRNGIVYWRRKGEVAPSFDPSRGKLRELSGYVGRVCPAHYPVLGQLRPVALQILSAIGREAAVGSWNVRGSPESIQKCTELSNLGEGG
jgi:hypothetical protein